MLNRRTFLYGASFTIIGIPIVLEAQQATKMSRVGFLSPTSVSDAGAPRRLGALRDGLRELGHVEGQNIAIEARWGAGNYDRLSELNNGA